MLHGNKLVLMMNMQNTHSNEPKTVSLSVLTAIFQVNLGQPVFIEAKDDGGGGDKLKQRMMEVVVTTGAISRAKLQIKSSPPTNQHPVFLQAGCPSCRPTNSVKALKGKYHVP